MLTVYVCFISLSPNPLPPFLPLFLFLREPISEVTDKRRDVILRNTSNKLLLFFDVVLLSHKLELIFRGVLKIFS